jgi:thiosulfate/3-mercaptopyruvate sulfurtransferase
MDSPLVDPARLFERLGSPTLRVVDCRFSLADPEAGARLYATSHVPGATYAHLERDLSSPVVAGKTGRHPLPELDRLAEFLGRSGIGNDSDVVVYDDAGGAMAARLWWLLRYAGHDRVALLDGGFGAWTAAGFPVSSEAPAPAPAEFQIRLRPELVASADEVEALRERSDRRLFDARAPERFRGEVEPIDPVAGHIPGARSLPFSGSLRDGKFLPPEELRQRFVDALDGVPIERAVAYCGSGVTACHHVLAAEQAGLSGLRLYAGSWSEWIANGERPVEKGG